MRLGRTKCTQHFHATVVLHGMDGAAQNMEAVIFCTGNHTDGRHHAIVNLGVPFDFQHNHPDDDPTVVRHEPKVR